MSIDINEYVNYKLECKIDPSFKSESWYSKNRFFIEFKKSDETYIPIISGIDEDNEPFKHSDYDLSIVINNLAFGSWIIEKKHKKH